MDTKKKTRPGAPKSRSRSAAQGKAAAARRAAPGKKRQPPKYAQQKKRPARTPEEMERIRQNIRQADEQLLRKPEEVTSDAQEMVFRMDPAEAKQRRRTPQDPAEAKRQQQRQRSAKRTQERKKQAAFRSKAPKVVYTQPKPINMNRLLLQLAAVMAVVIAISMGLSVFFKVENVVVYGNKAYSAWAVQEASGIEGGEKLMSFGRIRASGKIKAALPYVEKVRLGITLPDTVNIYITEYDVVYAIQDQLGIWWLMTSDGRIVEQTDYGTASGYTRVLGVTLDSPVVGERAVAYQEVVLQETTDSTEPTLETAPETVTAGEKLSAALKILDALELNDMVGRIASVDVTTLTNIEMWYGNQYQIRLGSANDTVHGLDYKITAMGSAIAQLSDYQTGILDVSFSTWTDQVGYTPFE